ncbi:MAG: MarR family transcriptional regulator [Pseudomonadota bacterium]
MHNFGILIEQTSFNMQRRILRLVKEQGVDMSFNELLVLFKMANVGGPITQQEIVQNFLKDKALISRVVGRLETKQFIRKTQSNTDSRAFELSLTRKGTVLVARVTRTVQAFEKRMLKDVDPSKLDIFFEVLTQIAEYSRDHEL